MRSFDLSQYASERRQWVDEALERHLPGDRVPPAGLHAAIRYSVFNGGKRIRPLLALAGAEAAQADSRRILPFACAVECIHTFSLIHDDLPAIDNDDLRRGHPTSHKVYGEAIAILAGDALLALSFQLIGLCRQGCEDDAVLDAIGMVAEASGTFGMVGGQVSDIESERSGVTDLSVVESIHRRKTGALLTASVTGSARLVGAKARIVDALAQYGRHIGLAFQITDDLLDIQGQTNVLGKPVGSDAKLDKATYPKIIGVERSRDLAHQAAAAAIDALKDLGPEAEPLAALASYIVSRDT